MRCVDCAHEAVERCEVTGAPLCAEHLWYAEDGRRVSERVARHLARQGVRVVSGKAYLEQLGAAAPIPRLPSTSLAPTITRQRERSEVIAAVAATLGGLSTVGCALLIWLPCCMFVPMFAIVLGTATMMLAPSAPAARRLRLLGLLSILGGAAPLLLLFANWVFGFGI